MPRLRIRADELRRRRAAAGIADTNSALAEHIGIHSATVSRVFSGRSAPGPAFIAALVAAFPGTRIDDLFEVIPDPQRRVAS